MSAAVSASAVRAHGWGAQLACCLLTLRAPPLVLGYGQLTPCLILPPDTHHSPAPNTRRLLSLASLTSAIYMWHCSVMNVIKGLAKVEEANQLGRQLPPEAFYNELIRWVAGRQRV